MLKVFCTLLSLLVALSLAAAQDAADTGWPIEERCLGEPTPPPEDWTFEGTVLTVGRYGIHGIRSDWETSRVLAFTHVDKYGYELRDGAFSPDLRWFAVAEGYGQCWTTCSSVAFQIEKLHVFDVSGNYPRSYSTIPWDLYYSAHPSGYNSPPIFWIDNENLIYHYGTIQAHNARQWNRLSGKSETWNGIIGLDFPGWNSPDLLRALDIEISYEAGTQTQNLQLINGLTGQVITTIPNPNNNLEPLPAHESVWSPDSSRFLMTRRLDADWVQLLLYDRAGNFLDTMMTLPSFNVERAVTAFEVFWSPDSHYIALQWIPTVPQYTNPGGPPDIDYTFSILDLERKQITDLCEKPTNYSFVWSPDSTQLASLEDGNLVILDRTTLTRYKAKRADQWFVIGWRDD